MHTDLYLNGCGAEPENNSRRFRVGTIYPVKDAHAACSMGIRMAPRILRS